METLLKGDILMSNKPINYYQKPSLILRGKIGRSILETIRNTPKSDDTKLKADVKKLKETILKAKADGTY